MNSRKRTKSMVFLTVEDVRISTYLVTKTPHFVEIGELRQVISVSFLKKLKKTSVGNSRKRQHHFSTGGTVSSRSIKPHQI